MNEIRRLREDSGMSQFAAARAANIERTRLALAEHNHVSLSQEQDARLRAVLLRAIRARRDRLNALLVEMNRQPVVEGVALTT